MPKPAFLTVAQWLSFICAAVFALAAFGAMQNEAAFAAAGAGLYDAALLRHAGQFLALLSAVLFVLGVGLWRGTLWTRPLAVAHWLLGLLPLVTIGARGAQLAANLALTAGGMAVTWWYLYRKPNVRAYYEAQPPRWL